MKKIALIVLVTFFVQLTFGQKSNVRFNKAINGIWGEWNSSNLQATGKYDDLIVYTSGQHPSNYIFRLEVIGMKTLFSSSKEDKNLRKKHLKEDKAFEFEGEITFYGATTFKDFIKVFPFINYGEGATSKPNNGSTAKVTVKIMPFKDKDGIRTYNIWHRDSGLALYLY